MNYKAEQIAEKKNGWLVTNTNTKETHTVYCRLDNNNEDAAINSLVKSMEEPPPPSESSLAFDARSQRDALLSQSDWTQVPDAPVNQAAWAEYRQALRDVPQQDGFPTDIEWPIKPE